MRAPTEVADRGSPVRHVGAREHAARVRRGSLWMIVASFLFAWTGVFGKLGLRHFTPVELLFYRALLGLTVTSTMFVWARGASPRTPHGRLHALRDAAGVTASLGFFVAIGALPIATATTLCYTSPLFMVLLSALFLRETLRPVRAGFVLVGFAGVALLLLPGAGLPHGIGAVAGVATGLLTAVSHLSTRHLGRVGEPPWRIIFWFNLVGTVVAGAAGLVLGFHALTPRGALVLAGLGLAELLAQFAMTRAYRDGDTLTVGSFSYSTVAFAALLGIVLWRDTLGVTAWSAIAIIVASGVALSRTATAPDEALVDARTPATR